MPVRGQIEGPGAFAAADLVRRATGDPVAVRVEASRVLTRSRDPLIRSFAAQALGLSRRDLGDARGALRALRQAVRFAEHTGDRRRTSDCRASLAATLVVAGRVREGLDALAQAESTSTGLDAARIEFRRGAVLVRLARMDEGLGALTHALRAFRRDGDRLWEAHALTNRGEAYAAQGRLDQATHDLDAAATLYDDLGQALAAAMTTHDKAVVASIAGRFPEALRLLDEARQAYAALHAVPLDLVADECAVLLRAGLPEEAVAAATAALASTDRTASPLEAVKVIVRGVEAATAVGDYPLAVRWSRQAARLVDPASDTSLLLALRGEEARRQLRGATPTMLEHLTATATEMTSRRMPDAVTAHLAAGRCAIDLRRPDAARRHLREAERLGRRGAAPMRLSAAVAAATRADLDVDPASVRRAARRGFTVLDTHLATLGASELRARSGRLVEELAQLAVRATVDDPRSLLLVSERARAVALRIVPDSVGTRSPGAADRAALRAAATALAAARAEGAPTTELLHGVRALEQRVARSARQSSGSGTTHSLEDLQRLQEALGARRLLSLVGIDGHLHLLVLGQRGVRRFHGGRLAEAAALTEQVRFLLRAGARSGAATAALLQPALDEALHELESAVLAPALRALGDGPVVVVPPARLRGLPWAALPSLRARSTAVSPSATAWLHAARRRPPTTRRTVLVGGPHLASGGGEVPALAARNPDATVLRDGAATATDVLAALDGAWLGHVAAHGTFRDDNPMFSTLELDDGPLTAFDLERLHRSPYRFLLTSCETAAEGFAGHDDVLGFTTAVMAAGTAGVLAAVEPVDDAATVGLSLVVHEQLAAGADLAGALLAARTAATGVPLATSTAWSFLAVGAA